MDCGIKLSHHLCIKILVELHDLENVQLSTHIQCLAKVATICPHMCSINGAHINIEVLLGLEHIKEDCELKPVPEGTIDKSWVLILSIGVAVTSVGVLD